MPFIARTMEKSKRERIRSRSDRILRRPKENKIFGMFRTQSPKTQWVDENVSLTLPKIPVNKLVDTQES